jgi:hypothetical protein
MANAIFTRFFTGVQLADYDLTVASIKCSLVRGYSFSATDSTVADVTGAGGTLNGTSAALGSPSVTSGVFDANDTSLTTTASASNHNLLLYQSSAVTGGADVPANQQLLIALFDTGTGLPIQPGTGTVTVTWSNGANKILKLS